jgi:hypothetical protein
MLTHPRVTKLAVLPVLQRNIAESQKNIGKNLTFPKNALQ